MTDLDHSFSVNQRDVIFETIDGEVLILNLKTGVYYSAEGTAAEVWEKMTGRMSLHQIVEELSTTYEVASAEVEGAVLSFVNELLAEELILDGAAAASNGERPPLDTHQGRAVYNPPSLKKYTDMQELLLLDPIHEVDEAAGWPVAKLETP
jgi:hypothetical protein